MGKRDAFGNEISGDDPLDAMGWKIGEGAAQAPTSVPGMNPATAPVAQAAPVTPAMQTTPTMPGSSTPVPRFDVPSLPTQLPNIPGGRSSFNPGAWIGRLVGLVIVLAVFGGIGFGLFAAFDTAKDVKNAFTVPKFTVPVATPPPADTPGKETKAETPSQPAKPSSPPSGLQPASLLRAGEFGRALVKMRAQGGRVQTMRLDPTRISANLLNKANSLRIFSATWDGNVQTTKTSSVLSGTSTVSLSAITSKAPSRAVARSAALLGRTAKQVNYVVLLNFAGSPQWMVYFKDGKYLRASLDGRRVQRVN